MANIPTNGLVFYASLSKDMATAETGQTFTKNGTLSYVTDENIPCVQIGASDSSITAPDAGLPIGSEWATMSIWGKSFGNILNNDIYQGMLQYGGNNTDGSQRNLPFWSDGNSDGVVFNVWGLPTSDFIASSITVWHHYLVLCGENNYLMYIDGNKVRQRSLSFSTLLRNISIGGGGPNDTLLAAARIYNRRLEDNEIKELSKEFLNNVIYKNPPPIVIMPSSSIPVKGTPGIWNKHRKLFIPTGPSIMPEPELEIASRYNTFGNNIQMSKSVIGTGVFTNGMEMPVQDELYNPQPVYSDYNTLNI